MIKDTLHLKAPGNWINDPNGFIYFNGLYHLFYQHFPYAPVWGTMHWGHAVSRDLIHWEHKDIALFPTKDYDQNGVFSGSALEKNGKLYLCYSAVKYLEMEEGNIHRAYQDRYETSQAMITSPDGFAFDNWDKTQIIPVIDDDRIAHKTHTRDPKVWEENGNYYMILGSTYKETQGRVLIFKSCDMLHWTYENQFQSPILGKILECPDLFTVGEQRVFFGSPMYIMNDGKEYAHHAVCSLAQFSPETCSLSISDSWQYIDYGLDLYAPQTNVDKDGNRVMIAWMRMPKAVEASDRKPWNGMMCLPRVVEVREGHICFLVHPQVNEYFCNRIYSREALEGFGGEDLNRLRHGFEGKGPDRQRQGIGEESLDRQRHGVREESLDRQSFNERNAALESCEKQAEAVCGELLKKGQSFRIKASLAEGEVLNIGGYEISLESQKIKADRSRVFAGLDGYRNVAYSPVVGRECSLNIFVEPNLIEVFVNSGEYVISNVVYELGECFEGKIDEIFVGDE